MPANTNQLSGKIGYTTIGAVSMAFRHWEAPLGVEVLDVSNFLSAGFDQMIVGFFGGTVDLEGAYDQGNMPLICGNLYTFHLGFNQTGLIEILMPAIVKEIRPVVDAKKEQVLRVSAKSTGVFTIVVL
jgi:hypothetical protein